MLAGCQIGQYQWGSQEEVQGVANRKHLRIAARGAGGRYQGALFFWHLRTLDARARPAVQVTISGWRRIQHKLKLGSSDNNHVATATRCGEKKATTAMKKTKSLAEEGLDGSIGQALTLPSTRPSPNGRGGN